MEKRRANGKKDPEAFKAQIVVGNPLRLEPRWNLTWIKDVLSLHLVSPQPWMESRWPFGVQTRGDRSEAALRRGPDHPARAQHDAYRRQVLEQSWKRCGAICGFPSAAEVVELIQLVRLEPHELVLPIKEGSSLHHRSASKSESRRREWISPVPPVTDGIAAFGRLTPQERGRERNAVQAPEPQILEETVEVVRQRTSEHMADVPRCLSRRWRLIARERVQQRSAKESLPYPCEKVVEAVSSIPRERTTANCRASWRCASISGWNCRDGKMSSIWTSANSGLPSNLRMCINLQKESSRRWRWSRVNECNSRPPRKVWRCLFHKWRKTVSKSSKKHHWSNFWRGSVNRSWMSLFHKLKCNGCSKWRSDTRSWSRTMSIHFCLVFWRWSHLPFACCWVANDRAWWMYASLSCLVSAQGRTRSG